MLWNSPKLELPDGTRQLGYFPNRELNKPRLMYHRHFMLSEHLGNLVADEAPPTVIAAYSASFARHLLKLNEQDQVREEFEKRDYGQWVHRLLDRFHRQFPRITGVPREALIETLHALADEEFASAVEFNYLSMGWKLRWASAATTA